MKQKGFTLIELLVVLIILGIIIAIAFPVFASQVRRAREALVISYLGGLARELEAYRVEHGRFPADLQPNEAIPGFQPWPNPVPLNPDSSFDYDYWGVGGETCVVQVTHFGFNAQREHARHTRHGRAGEIVRTGDDIIKIVSVFSCGAPKGAVK